MAVPIQYVFRNLWTRRLTTLLTSGGVALVVFVFATVLMLDAGLRRTLVTTGEFDNVVAIRKGAENEIQSGVTVDCLVMGRYPGSGEPVPVAFPDPAQVSQEIDKIQVLTLPQLIQLKLAARRYCDFGDVVF